VTLRSLAPALIAVITAGCGGDRKQPETARVAPAPSQTTPSPHGPEFWKTWGDGQAELNGYNLTYPRYGQARKGTAVAIFVTETFAKEGRVKSDPGRRPPAAEVPVMKLNLVRNFQTGIYDYNNMLSAFVALAEVGGRAYGLPSKISFSSQEWCGHVYSQLLFDDRLIRQSSHSYFDGEGDATRDIEIEPLATTEDALLLWARGMAWPYTAAGASDTVQLISSLERARTSHVPAKVITAELHAGNQPEKLRVPAGAFNVHVRTAKLSDETVWTYYVEADAPYRIVKWESSTGERAELLGSDRMKYWEMNQEGGEQALKRLGLPNRYVRSKR
jgi:hypothetical protein